MRFIRGRTGLDVMDHVERLNKTEYLVKKETLFSDVRFREWWVPKGKNFEKILVLMFGRSNKWLSKPVMRYHSGRMKLHVYQFNCTYIIVEHIVGKNLISIKFDNIDDRFKFLVLSQLMSEERSLKKLIELYIVKSESLYTLSDLWKRYIESGKTDKFKDWVKKTMEFNRLIKYRKTHVTRDNLRLVS